MLALNACAAQSSGPLQSGGKRTPPRRVSHDVIFRGVTFRSKDDQGQSMVEFALSLPVMLLIVTGICTFGIAMNNYLLLTDATNIAARQLAISSGSTTDPCALVVTAVRSAAPILTASSLSYNIMLNGVSYTTTTCGTSTGAPANLVTGSTAKVTITYPCTLKVYGANLIPGCTLQAQTAELVQ